jgi:hypothetical protein
LLRVPDGSGGKQAQCPQCQAMVQVPINGATAAAPPASNPFATNIPPAAPATSSDNPYQAPASAFAPQSAAAGPGIYPLVPSRLEMGEVLNRTWEIFKTQMGMVILVIFAVGAINWGANMISSVVLQAITLAVNEPAIAAVFQAVAQITLTILQIWLGLGQLRFMLKIGRGQAAEFSDVFTGGPYLLAALGGSIVIGAVMVAISLVFLGPAGAVYLATQQQEPAFIALGIGLVLFMPIVIFIALSISQFQQLIVDRGMGAMESLRMSNQIMSGNRLALFGLGIVLALINMLGCAALCIGLFFTASYSALATAVAYLMMTGQPTADQLMRGAPPPMTAPPAL